MKDNNWRSKKRERAKKKKRKRKEGRLTAVVTVYAKKYFCAIMERKDQLEQTDKKKCKQRRRNRKSRSLLRGEALQQRYALWGKFFSFVWWVSNMTTCALGREDGSEEGKGPGEQGRKKRSPQPSVINQSVHFISFWYSWIWNKSISHYGFFLAMFRCLEKGRK